MKVVLKATSHYPTDLCHPSLFFFFKLADINPESPDYYMIGHCIDGRVLYPATGYLVLAWRTLMRSLGTVLEHTPVTFEDVTIHRATILPKIGEWFSLVQLISWTCGRGSSVVTDLRSDQKGV